MHTTKALTTGAVIALTGVLAAGVGFAAAESRKAQAQAAEAARDYTPAVTYTPPPEPTTVAFLGDSFTAGAGAEGEPGRWTSLLAKDMGWVELNYGYGGTNYATAGDIDGGKPYADRLTDLIVSQPDIVIVSTAGNDMETDQHQGIERTYKTLREELPDAEIISTSPYYGAEDYPEALAEMGDDIEEATEAVGGHYLDIGHPLKGHPEAMTDDNIHPNGVGYQLIADAVLKEIAPVVS